MLDRQIAVLPTQFVIEPESFSLFSKKDVTLQRFQASKSVKHPSFLALTDDKWTSRCFRKLFFMTNSQKLKQRYFLFRINKVHQFHKWGVCAQH